MPARVAECPSCCRVGCEDGRGGGPAAIHYAATAPRRTCCKISLTKFGTKRPDWEMTFAYQAGCPSH